MRNTKENRCIHCANSFNKDDKYCGVCGEDLFIQCPICKSENQVGNNFCVKCKHSLY